MTKHKLEIPISTDELTEIMTGDTKHWNMLTKDGAEVDVTLRLVEADDEMEELDGEYD